MKNTNLKLNKTKLVARLMIVVILVVGVLNLTGCVSQGNNNTNKRDDKYIHRLVGEAFIFNDDPINKNQINHKNCNRSKNYTENLEWVSPKQNTEYTIKLIITANSKQATLKTATVETLNSGESKDNPIIINSVQELAGMNKDNDGYYRLGSNINVDGSLSTIFNSSTQFKGHFDGAGYTISGITLS